LEVRKHICIKTDNRHFEADQTVLKEALEANHVLVAEIEVVAKEVAPRKSTLLDLSIK
jgi:hypothetical protein